MKKLRFRELELYSDSHPVTVAELESKPGVLIPYRAGVPTYSTLPT